VGIIRKTKSVRAILDQFKKADTAISVVDMVDRVGQDMNKTTVYRILERLEDEGSLHSFMGGDGNRWYAKCKGCSSHEHQDTHPHFQCKDCGKTECLTLDISIPSLPGHKVESASLLLVGQCQECQA